MGRAYVYTYHLYIYICHIYIHNTLPYSELNIQLIYITYNYIRQNGFYSNIPPVLATAVNENIWNQKKWKMGKTTKMEDDNSNITYKYGDIFLKDDVMSCIPSGCILSYVLVNKTALNSWIIINL